MMRIHTLVFVIFLVGIAFCNHRNYRDAKIFKLDLGNDENELLMQFYGKLDFWTELEIQGNKIEVYVISDIFQKFVDYLDNENIDYEIKTNVTVEGKRILLELPPRLNLTGIINTFGSKLDFWTPLRKKDKAITVTVDEDHKIIFHEFLKHHGIRFSMNDHIVLFRLKPPINMIEIFKDEMMLDFRLIIREDENPAFIQVYNFCENVLNILRTSTKIPYTIENLHHKGRAKFDVQPSEHLGILTELYGTAIDFWTPLNEQGKYTKLLVDPDMHSSFINFLKTYDIKYKTVIKDRHGTLEFWFEPEFSHGEIMNYFGRKVDFWTPSKEEGNLVTVLVNPEIVEKFVEYLTNNKVDFNRIYIKEETNKSSLAIDIHLKYLPVNLIQSLLKILSKQPDIKYVETKSVGITFSYSIVDKIEKILKSKGVWFSVEKWPTEFQISTYIDRKQKIEEVEKKFQNKVSIWGPHLSNSSYVKLLVLPEVMDEFVDYLEINKFHYEELVSDVEDLLRKQSKFAMDDKYSEGNQLLFTRYEKLENIVDYLYYLAVKYPEIVTVDTLGLSTEEKEIVVVKITRTNEKVQDKPIVLIDAGIHGRDWIGPTVSLYIINQLVVNGKFLNNVDWYVIPVLNPDGYEYSHLWDRLWRKNRKRYNNSTCVGVDLNRNFDFHWTGSQETPCSESYPGPYPFSEKETSCFRDFVTGISNRIKLYISLHSFGNMILYPWGFSNNKNPENDDELRTLGQNVARRMFEFNGRSQYTVGRISEVLHLNPGNSLDFMKGKLGIDLSYAIEIYDGDENGEFEPIAEDILPTCQEIFIGVKTFYYHIQKKYFHSQDHEEEDEEMDIKYEIETQAYNTENDDEMQYDDWCQLKIN